MALILLFSSLSAVAAGDKPIGLNVMLNADVTDDILAELGTYGRVRDVIQKLDAVTMQVRTSEVDNILVLPYVVMASPDAERKGAPIDTIFVEDNMDGLSTWNLDAINVTDYGWDNRQVPYDGEGVYVAMLDTGLVDSWRRYFPEERIAVEYAICFGCGGGDVGWVSTQPNKWEHDQSSHGTHVTSTVLGYDFSGAPINGVAPLATVIPVKVLNQNGSGWSSVIARGIVYVADLKDGPLADYPVVLNMSLGGPHMDELEKAAIDYAISKGVIVVASAGNEGKAGMGYPGAYAPVISVAASGYIGEWYVSGWWYRMNVVEPTDPLEFYIADFSSRALPGQDLDVAAPGSWIVGPYQINSGQLSYYYLGGTSMASPHVAGIAALMMQKNSFLVQADVESILEVSATYLAPGCRTIIDPSIGSYQVCWGADATGAGLITAGAALINTP